jgi:hypothetical protein
MPYLSLINRVPPFVGFREMKEVVTAVQAYSRKMRQFATSSVWPALGFRHPALSRNTVTKTLRDDLKLFADEMMRRVGQDYFLLTKSRNQNEMAHARALRSAGENWRYLAQVPLVESEVEE